VFVALVVVVLVVCVAYVGSGAAKLTSAAARRNLVDKLHVPANLVVPLGLLDFVGAGGLIAGLWVRWIGLAAGIAGVGYFSSALTVEVKAGGHARQCLPPLLLGFVCIAATGFRGAVR
jgi:hypothetical protein